jgi:DNA-binding LytR/AlgR family response regulator
MKILVVEDDPFVADDLREKLEHLQHRITAVVDDYESAVDAIETELPDLVLLDIELKGARTGIEFGEKLSRMKIPHIYISGIQDMTTYMHAKRTAPIRNLAKPIDLINLRNALDVDLQTYKPPGTVYLIADGNRSKKRIDPNRIHYIKADGSYCGVHLEDKTYKLTINMKTCLQKLDWPDIVRVSKSHAINLQYVKSKLGNCIEMTDGARIDVEPKYRDVVNLHLKSI